MVKMIDPLSFFSPTGVKELPPPPVLKRPSEHFGKENVSANVKKTRIEKDEIQVVSRRMPGVPPVSDKKSTATSNVSQLWVEKYKPVKISDLVGNGMLVSKLVLWLKEWRISTSLEKRAVLLSGPPGIGKSSTARLACEEAGYTVLEFNASDTRSKQAIDELASGLTTNKVLFANNAAMGSRVAVIMDEVDGMAGSGDRGGSGALIQMIKKSKLPVICICNDRQDSKIRSLANHCLDLRFLRPSCEEIAKRAHFIACNEKMSAFGMKELMEVAEAASCDMRQVINHLELMRSTTGNITEKKSDVSRKDDSMEPFAIVKGLLTSAVARNWSYEKRNELFFTDYDMIPLLVQQNYLKAVEKVTDSRVIPAIKKAAEFISVSDIVGKAIRTDAQWALLPEYGTLSTVAPSFACNNILQFPEFPAWLGKQSSQGKNSRLLKELRTMIGGSLSTCTSRNLKLSGYSDVLFQVLIGNLSSDGDGIKRTIQFLDEMGVPKDSLFEVLAETRFPWQTDPYAIIDSKTKAALTRSYNSGNHLIKSGTGVPRTKKNDVVRSKLVNNDEDDEDDNILEENDEPDKNSNSPVQAVKQKTAKPKKRN